MNSVLIGSQSIFVYITLINIRLKYCCSSCDEIYLKLLCKLIFIYFINYVIVRMSFRDLIMVGLTESQCFPAKSVLGSKGSPFVTAAVITLGIFIYI